MNKNTSRSGGGTTESSATPAVPARVLITGACRGVGLACAEEFARRGAKLILADNDARELGNLARKLGGVARYCDVASEASVTVFAAEVMALTSSLDVLINAAGGGYERTLGMYRVSRALLPALRQGSAPNLLLNIPPAEEDAEKAIFPYASSQQAFQRLCAALAAETRGSSVRVLIGCSQAQHILEVVPDPNAAQCGMGFEPHYDNVDDRGLAAEIVALLYRPDPSERTRKAG